MIIKMKKGENWIEMMIEVDGEIYGGSLMLLDEEDAIRGMVEQSIQEAQLMQDKQEGLL